MSADTSATARRGVPGAGRARLAKTRERAGSARAPGRSRRPRVHAVILAGGAGERFWPASRRDYPKPCLRVEGGHTLLEATVARAERVAPRERIWIVCGREHAELMRSHSRLPAARLLVEPRRCNTAMAVASAALRIAREDPEAVLAVLPADHHIPDERAFAAAVQRACAAAAAEDVLVTLGVRPTRPDPGLGYIATGQPVGSAHPGLHRVRRFVEKPDRAKARRYVKSGGYLWNSGIFVWRARAILEEIETHAPDLQRALAPLRKAGRGVRAFETALARAYRRAPRDPIDTAVLERSRRMWCLPVDFPWSDVGTWASLAKELGVGPNVTKVIDGEAILYDSGGNLVWGDDRPVVLLGVEGLAVIDAGDALLVAKLDRSADVRRIVSRLREQGRRELI